MINKILILGHRGRVGKSLSQHFSLLKDKEVLHFDGNLNEAEELNLFLSKHSDIGTLINAVGKFSGTEKQIFESNVSSTASLMSCLSSLSFKPKIIHLSSGGIYLPSLDEKDESSSPDPKTYYTFCKYLSEEIMRFYSKDMNIFILRLGSVFGNGIDNGFIYNMEINARLHGEIKLTGSLDKIRSILDIDYLIRMISYINLSPDRGAGLNILNISTQTIKMGDYVNFLMLKYPETKIYQLPEDITNDNYKLFHMNLNNTAAQSMVTINEENRIKI